MARLVLAAVLIIGCAVRLFGLDRGTLRDDELNHYYVALSLQRGDDPVLPSGEWYLRGLDYSRAVAATLNHVQSVERAVRLPSALLGCVALLLFAAIAWSVAGPWAAVCATFLFTLYPEAIHQSRSGRFYTMQLVYGLVALYAGWRALGGGATRELRFDRIVRTWMWALVAAAAFALAARVQVVSVSVALAWALAVAATAVADLRAWGRAAPRWSVALQLSALGALAGGLLLLLRPETLPELVVRAVSVPYWARVGANQGATYAAFLVANLPLVAAAAAAAFYYVVRRRGALGLYLLVWFSVPFTLHSALPWKTERFILLALPALFLAAGIAAADLFVALHAMIRARATAWRLRPPLPAFAANALVVMLALAALTPAPAFTRVILPLAGSTADVSCAAAPVPGPASTGDAIPFGHVFPLPALHYRGRLDFSVNDGLREQWLTRERKKDMLGADEPGGYVLLPMGAPDLYTGRPVLSTPGAIRERFADAGRVLIEMNARSLLRDGVRPELYETLRAEATELYEGRCGAMLLFHWRFGAEAVEPMEGVAS